MTKKQKLRADNVRLRAILMDILQSPTNHCGARTVRTPGEPARVVPYCAKRLDKDLLARITDELL